MKSLITKLRKAGPVVVAQPAVIDEGGSGEVAVPMLRVFAGSNPVSSHVLDDKPFTIGRRPENSLQLAVGAVSQRHARITREDGEFVLSDLGSSNGTLVNGQRIGAVILHGGEEIRIGPYRLSFEWFEEGATADAVNNAPAWPTIDNTLLTPSTSAGWPAIGPRIATHDPRDRHTLQAAQPLDNGTADSQSHAAPVQGMDAPMAPRAPLAAPPAKLMVMSGAKRGEAVPLSRDKTKMGAAGKAVVIIEKTATGHAVFAEFQSEHCQLNGRVIGEHPVNLNDGDVIQIGANRVKYTLDEAY
jgi:pSer/pThr/pTyr-binding forkhead associated (FHA) protein